MSVFRGLPLVVGLVLLIGGEARADGGHFVGPIRVEWVADDARRMKLLRPLVYVDPSGRRWEAPAGAELDGASIPKAFWSVIGGPFEGKYRSASIVHDYYCDVRLRRWQDVHRMFYEGMLTSGVDPTQAKIMYFAVLYGGPRWDEQAIYNTHLATGGRDGSPVRFTSADRKPTDADLSLLQAQTQAASARLTPAERLLLPTPQIDEGALSAAAQEIQRENPSLAQLEKMADEARVQARRH